MVELSVSAPGKVILYGEHAVVFGKTALAVSIDLRTKLHLKESTDTLTVNFPDLNKVYSWRIEELEELRQRLCVHPDNDTPEACSQQILAYLQNFITTSCGVNKSDAGIVGFLYLYLKMFTTLPSLSIHVTSDIPIGAGLGSSAALSVCSAGGLYLHSVQKERVQLTETISDYGARDPTKLDVTREEKTKISEWAFMFEKIMHGTPSGIDNSVSTFGGVLAYRSGRMSPVSDLTGVQILLVNTHVPRNTRELVSAVRLKYSQLPKVIGPMLDAIERVSQTAISTLQTSADKGFTLDCVEEFKTLEHLIDINHGILTGLGVSHPALSKVVEISATHCIHAKLTGAGGGGFALGLIHPHVQRSQVDRARENLEEYGYTCYEIDIGGHGIQAWSS
eukprot:TRINITY_DN7058_c0_g1_i1.p1 TRINITY_DN7058_c0_g1~~TRINITY_DN7058_c0_g1_i1.p1  ORF type:complete len:392 (+),score=58.75 TRINITY_DN7058_c0_g1_i1:64-1239(+)